MRRHPHFGAELSTTIDRLNQIAVQAGDALLGEGPVNPDHELLDSCAGALTLFKQAAEVRKDRDQLFEKRGWTDEDRAKNGDLFEHEQFFEKKATQTLRKARKTPALTPAGIYAKALVVRQSKTGAALLAMTLASDLIACESLRQSLWPATREAK